MLFLTRRLPAVSATTVGAVVLDECGRHGSTANPHRLQSTLVLFMTFKEL